MRIKKSVFCLISFFLIIAVLFQVIFIVINLFHANDNINFAMFINNYIIGFLIIGCLFFNGASSHFLAIAFFGCYMLFLMGQKPFKPEYDVFLTFVRLKLDTTQYFVFSCVLFLGLVCTYYSYMYMQKICKIKILPHNNYNYGNNNYFKVLLTIILLVTLPCAFYMQAKIVLVRSELTYVSGYLINVDVPLIIKVGYYIYSTVVLLYLALKPAKWQLCFVLGTYIVIEGGMQLFQGRRALFAATILFAIWYLLKYIDDIKIKRKSIVIIGIVLATMVVLFYIVEQMRDSSNTGLTSQFLQRFFISTGGSDSVIANTIYRKNDFTASGITYLLDPFINNPIGNMLLDNTTSAQGLTYLEQHNSFSHWLSYMTDEALYTSGHGMGSSYLAETYLAFGTFGVAFVSVIIGWIIRLLNNIEFNNNLFKIGLVFFLVRYVFTLPRAGLFSCVSGLVYLIFTCMLIYPFYNMWRKNDNILSYRKGSSN